MRPVLFVLVLAAATGCGGRWLSVEQPILPLPTRPPRDYRVVLRNDSVLVLHDAVVRNDSLVEVARGEPSQTERPVLRGVDLADVVQVEAWQPGGERIAGGVIVTLLAIGATIAYIIGKAIAD